MYKKLRNRIKNWVDWNPPTSLSTKGWRYFKKDFKETAPIRYWFKHSLQRKYILPVKYKYNAMKEWIRFRTHDKYHIINTGLSPDYYDIRTIMLHGNFNLLKDFVEVEQAWHHYCWSDNRQCASWFEKHIPFYRVFYKFRSAEMGVEYLNWAATLDDPTIPVHERSEDQAQSAIEILHLYRWWTVVRPGRKVVVTSDYNDQGLGILGALDTDFDRTADDYVRHQDAMAEKEIVEADWDAEDTEMLIRLMKIRRKLWT
jgi:hypothetical protein